MKIENTILTNSQNVGGQTPEANNSRQDNAAVTQDRPAHQPLQRTAAVNEDAKVVNEKTLVQQVEEEENDSSAAEQHAKLASLVEKLNDSAQKVKRDLRFTVDDKTSRPVVTVTDGNSGKVIRQIPSEEALKLSEKLEQFQSLLLEAQA